MLEFIPIEIRNYIDGDIFRLTFRDPEPDYLMFINKGHYNNLLVNTANSKTILFNNQIILLGSIFIDHTNVGHGIFILSKEFKDAFKTQGKKIIKEIKKYIQESKFRRIQTFCRQDFPEAQKLLRVLGFKPEALLLKYNPDQSDTYIYTWLRDAIL